MPRYLVQVLGPPLVADTRSGAIIDFPAGKTLATLAYLLLHHAPPLDYQLYYRRWAMAGARWRAYLTGSSVDTRVMVRDLRVTRGLRYARQD